MARVYQNGLPTIAASADQSENPGCFRTRKRKRVRPLHCSAAWPDGMPKYIFADRRASEDGTRPCRALDTRGWVLQEQLLSPRVLSYADQELYWDCLSLRASESLPNWDSGILRSGLWRKVVEEYSMRRLTHNGDKLVALLGVAKEAARILDDKFMGGLWRKTLWRALLWAVADPELSSRQGAPVAPSWSWASLDAAAAYDLAGSDTDADMIAYIEVVEVGEASEESFGLPRITGEIALRGRLPPLLGTGASTEPAQEAFPQWSEDIHGTDIASVWALIVAASDANTYGVGITKVDGDEGRYRRVGRLCWRKSPSSFRWDMEKKRWVDET
ncbi:hypothetical protein QBC47DRAFT_439820 [Echria macrotheca]|uniref:Uncharacterized protein n=1 Tax=Echria macrotheca TaxID=438768 RepID=A0AAJ0B156_9PEZI|nr:hypothetical protein QBC47DRAFT_439820 [Echria macrotheca]